ncbi:MAG TPA: hypothetical protein VF614_16335 [Chthoniobacteraceae bacterium]
MKASPLFLCAIALPSLLFAAAAAPDKIPAGYTVETVEIPKTITLSVGGLAFTPKGELMICTREGEVWRYSQGQWHLFAEGLHEPLGIHVDQKTSDVWVVQRPEMTRLVDENADGRADLYQTVNADWGITDNYHEYAYGPARDAQGNFYGTLNTTLSWPGWAGSSRWDVARVHDSRMGRAAKYRGWAFQITPEGKFVPFASGLRSPAGVGMNLEGDLFVTDNQGDWVGSSTLQHVAKGRFYGHASSLMDHPDYTGKDLNQISVEDYARLRTLPSLWLPHGDLSNSPGEPTADSTQGKFGPFAGQFFIGDQTRSNIMRAYVEKVGGEYQGVVFNFVHPLQSGCLRTAFGPDGALWVGQTGRGWRSVGPEIYGLQRIVWNSTTTPMEMQKINATPQGFRITFTKPVDRELAAGPARYQIRHFHYAYRPEYGSPKMDETTVVPSKVVVSADGLTVDLEMPLVTPKVYRISLVGIPGADGMPLSNETGWYTLNQVPK